MENFKPPGARETGNLANGQDSDGSGDEEHRTPKEEKMDTDDPGSGGRITRGKLILTLLRPAMFGCYSILT